MITATNLTLLAFLALMAFGIARMRNLFVVTMLAGIYSLLSATIFVLLDAVDVAFTEAAVGAGITTVLFLGAILLTDGEAKPRKRRLASIGPLLLVTLMGLGLVYTTLDPRMPRFGDPKAPAHVRLAPEFLADKVRQEGRDKPTSLHIPNVVTTTLASYRSFDTLGEVVVVFTAGVAVMVLLGGGTFRRRRRRNVGPKPDNGTGGEAVQDEAGA